MAKNYDFDILESYDHDQFKENVKKYLNEGWELHGHMIAFPNFKDEDGTIQSVRYIQAFVKNVPSTKPLGFTVQK